MKPSSNKYYQTTNENGDIDIVTEEEDIKKLIEIVNDCDMKLTESYKLWKVLKKKKLNVSNNVPI